MPAISIPGENTNPAARAVVAMTGCAAALVIAMALVSPAKAERHSPGGAAPAHSAVDTSGKYLVADSRAHSSARHWKGHKKQRHFGVHRGHRSKHFRGRSWRGHKKQLHWGKRRGHLPKHFRSHRGHWPKHFRSHRGHWPKHLRSHRGHRPKHFRTYRRSAPRFHAPAVRSSRHGYRNYRH